MHQKTFLAFLVNSFQFNYTLVVSLTTNVGQVYHSLSSFHPWQILLAVHLKINRLGQNLSSRDKPSAVGKYWWWQKICQNKQLLASKINIFLASAERPFLRKWLYNLYILLTLTSILTALKTFKFFQAFFSLLLK